MKRTAKEKKALDIYVFGNVAFVLNPHVRGCWIRTHACVAATACPLDACRAEIGEACKGARGLPVSDTHVARRNAAKGRVD